MLKELVKKQPLLGSSKNPQELSRTVSSGIRMVAVLLLYLGVDIPESELENIALLSIASYEALKALYFASARLYNTRLFRYIDPIINKLK